MSKNFIGSDLNRFRFASAVAITWLCCVTPSVGSNNSFRIDQVYSNLDGTIQYIQLRESAGLNGKNHLAGMTLRRTHNGVTKEFVFPADLPSGMTANEWLLIATTDCVPFYGDGLEAVGEWNCAPRLRLPLLARRASLISSSSHPISWSPTAFYSSPTAWSDSAQRGQIIPGWQRTGYSVVAWTSPVANGQNPPAGLTPVCRLYIPPIDGNSHFYSVSSQECVGFPAQHPEVYFETDAAFFATMPDLQTGACPADQARVYRLWNPLGSSHRYTTQTSVRDEMLMRGYVAEGYGPDGVAMCVGGHK